jgi:hypothetical protein
VAILAACWDAFVQAADSASGKSLRKGPRGGGRSVEQIAGHVTGSHANGLRSIYYRQPLPKADDFFELMKAIKQADASALTFATSDQMPETGPRGGALRSPRYFVRRAAWHILDHAWEIEDRIE